MTEKINYNMASLMGSDVSDDEYASMFDIPLRLVNTPELNNFMLDKMYDDNVKFYIDEGLSDKEAKNSAGEKRSRAADDIKKAMARRGLL